MLGLMEVLIVLVLIGLGIAIWKGIAASMSRSGSRTVAAFLLGGVALILLGLLLIAPWFLMRHMAMERARAAQEQALAQIQMAEIEAYAARRRQALDEPSVPIGEAHRGADTSDTDTSDTDTSDTDTSDADTAASASGDNATADGASGENTASTGEAVAEDGGAASRGARDTVADTDGPSDEHATADVPAWVNKPPVRTGDVHSVVVTCGPYLTTQECFAAYDAQVRDSVHDYARWYIVNQLGIPVRGFSIAGLSMPVPEVDAQQQFLTGRDYQLGYMHTLYTRLEFDASYRALIERRCRERMTQQRLAVTGAMSVGLLFGLAALFGMFRLVAGHQRRTAG